MPGLFTTLVHRLNDAVEYHAEYAADVQSGHRNKNGFKTDLWHQREREAEERSRRRRHRHRRHHGEGKEGETGEESVMMSGALVEGGAKEAEGEAAAAPEGVVDPFADPGAEKEDSQGKQEHRRRGGEGHGHRRRHRDTNDAGIEILEPSSGPLGRELPPGPPGQGPPIQGPGPQGPPRQRSKWEHKRTGRSMSPQKVEMRPWLRKLLKKGPTAQKGGKGMPQAMNGPPFPMGDPRGQQGRRMTPPGQPYIDEEESASGHPYVGSNVSFATPPADAALSAAEPPHDATTEERELAEAEQDAHAMEEGHEPPHDPTTERELAEEAEDARNRAPRVDEQREIPLAMPEPGDFIPSPSGHSAPTPGQFPHLNLDTDTESEGSGPGDEADDSDASTRATTAPPLDTHKQRSPGLDTVTKAPPLDASKSDKSELRKADDAGASNKATITPPSDAPNGKNSKKGASMRGGAGDYSDAEEYDFHEAYDDEYTNRDRTPPPHNRTPRDNSSHASHTHTYTSHHTHSSHTSHFSHSFTPGPSRSRRVPQEQYNSPFYRYGPNHVPQTAYNPPPRSQPRVPPPGGYHIPHGPSNFRPPPRHGPRYNPPSRGPQYKPRRRTRTSEADDDPDVEYAYDSTSSSAYSSSDSKYEERSSGTGRSRPPQPRGRREKAVPPKPEDYYAILEVERGSTESEIRAAAKKMRIKVHPDRLNLADKSEEEKATIQARAVKVGQAADVLGDEGKRRIYDEEVEDWEERWGDGAEDDSDW